MGQRCFSTDRREITQSYDTFQKDTKFSKFIAVFCTPISTILVILETTIRYLNSTVRVLLLKGFITSKHNQFYLVKIKILRLQIALCLKNMGVNK